MEPFTNVVCAVLGGGHGDGICIIPGQCICAAKGI